VLKQVKYAGSTTYSGAGVGTSVIYLQEEVTITAGEMLVKPGSSTTGQPPRRLEIEVQPGMQHIDFSRSPGRTPGIYRAEGATLMIAYPTGNLTVRPTTFENTNDIVLVFERVRR
jgi:hypothetical protein